MKKNTFNLNMVCSISKWTPPTSIVLFIFIFLFCSLFTKSVHAQTGVAINVTGQPAKSSAALDLSTGNAGKYGFLAPKVALQATNVAAPITSPSNGLMVFDTVTAGTAPYNVSEGFYYWNSTKSQWIGLNSAPHYAYSWAATSNVGPATTSYTAMGPTITFTPVHSTVYLTFTAAGFSTNATYIYAQNVQFEVLKGATVLAGGTSLCELKNSSNATSSFNFSMVLPITVTPGTSTTISIDWKTTAAAGLTADPDLYCPVNSASYPDDSNAALFITD